MGAGRDAQLRVRFDYHTGLRRDAFDAAELTGSWDRRGRGSPDVWTTAPMRKTTDQDGCWRFTAEVELGPRPGSAGDREPQQPAV
jgi:hypothetical protein